MKHSIQKVLYGIITVCILLFVPCFAEAQSATIDEAIASAAGRLASSLEKGKRVAVINCVSDSAKLSEYVISETALALVNSRKFVLVERKDIDLVKAELEFQLSGDVSDESAQSIGKMLGAEVIITASFDGTGSLRMKAIAVETAEILAMSSATVRKDEKLAFLSDDRRVIEVSSLTELMQAIGPDRVIRIAPGTYDLSKGFTVKNKYVTWVNEYDGPCPVIKSVSNLAFIGEGKATLVIKPAYGWVFSFETCSGIRISGLTLGHTVPGYCLGGVLRFKNCDDTEVRSCELYGSGTYGIGLERASDFVMDGCVIRDCTYGLATIERSSNVSFRETSFRDTGEFALITVQASDRVSWSECAFERNHGSALFSVDAESREIRVERSTFSRNKVDSFCDNPDSLSVDGAQFTKNSFEPLGD